MRWHRAEGEGEVVRIPCLLFMGNLSDKARSIRGIDPEVAHERLRPFVISRHKLVRSNYLPELPTRRGMSMKQKFRGLLRKDGDAEKQRWIQRQGG